MVTVKENTKPQKIDPPKVNRARLGNTQGNTNRMLDNLLADAGLVRDEGGTA